jgi:hypothetical protein
MKIQSYTEFNSNASIDSLGYGNEQIDHRLSYVKGEEPDVIRAAKDANIFNALMNQHAPKNSSKTTINELAEMVKFQSELTEEDIKFIQRAEDDMVKLIAEYLKEIGIDEDHTPTMERIAKYTDPLLYLLKNHYNRPRPHQLARVLNVDMFPVIATSAGSASYPSGHALDSFCFAAIISDLHPEHRAEIDAFCAKVAETRIKAGVHYRSDRDFSEEIAKMMFDSGVLKIELFT